MLYHLTARENIERVHDLARLESTAFLMEAADQRSNVRARRMGKLPLSIGPHRVVIRDQAPLRAGNIEFEAGWGPEDLVDDLNRRVFFWSGWEHGPIEHGLNHFERYRSENPVLLRVRFESLRSHNQEHTPLFCKFNSDSPRCYHGRRSPRGPATFLPAQACPYGAGSVVEVTFLYWVTLPPDTEVSNNLGGGWRAQFNEH